jgi:hypothetical protein
MPRKGATAEVVNANDIPPDVIGAVVLADLAQIEADAITHQDGDARRRILFAAERLRQIAQADLSSDLLAVLPRVASILDEKTAPISAAV